MKRLASFLLLSFACGSLAVGQTLFNFGTGAHGFAPGAPPYNGSSMTRIDFSPDPTGKNPGIVKLQMNFVGAGTSDKATAIWESSPRPSAAGAQFLTYWIYVPDSVPSNYSLQVFVEDDGNWNWCSETISGASIPRHIWWPVSVNLAQFSTDATKLDLLTHNIGSTGLQFDNISDAQTPWLDSIYVSKVTISGVHPHIFQDFETNVGGFLPGVPPYNGTSMSRVTRVSDPTAKSTGVMQLNVNFSGVGPGNKATAIWQSTPRPGVPGAKFLTYWIYVPDSIPSNYNLQVFAQDDGNWNWCSKTLSGASLPRNKWWPISLDLGQFSTDATKLDLVAHSLGATGLQFDNLGDTTTAWTDSLYVDNVAFLYDTVGTATVKELVLSNFNTNGDIGQFSAQSWGPAFTGVSNGVDTTNAANRVLNVACAFDTGNSFKGAIQRANLTFFGDTNATAIAVDIFIPSTMPDSVHFDLALNGPATNNGWWQDEKVLGIDFLKGAWATLRFNITAHIADGSITNPHGSAVFYVQAYYINGSKWSGTIMLDNLRLEGIDRLVSVDQQVVTPYAYKLDHNYPNPFNPTTTINYELQKGGTVTLKVYDVLGQEVAILVDGSQQAGPHSVVFDAKRFASGTYFYVLRAGAYVKTEKMMLLK